MNSSAIIAENAGFCFGVKRAINLVEKSLNEFGGVYSLGPVIHNPQVVEDLRKKGVQTVDSINDIPNGSTVVIRSHGVTKSIYITAKEKGINIIDATCPFVKKPQINVEKLGESGYSVIVVGKPNHPEVIGIVSYAENVIVIDPSLENQSISDILKAGFKSEISPKSGVLKINKVGVVAQTTLKLEDFQSVVVELIPFCEELKVYNTICNATRNIQWSTRQLASKVDLMVIVGGKNSSNTNKLFDIAKSITKTAVFIEEESELDDEIINKHDTIGVSAGASTPEWIINSVYDKILKIKNKQTEETL